MTNYQVITAPPPKKTGPVHIIFDPPSVNVRTYIYVTARMKSIDSLRFVPEKRLRVIVQINGSTETETLTNENLNYEKKGGAFEIGT